MSETGGVLLLGDDLAYLTQLSNELRSVRQSVILSQAAQPVRQALKGAFGEPDAAVVCLNGSENIGDVRSLMGLHARTTFLFLSRQSPPRSAMAHAVRSSGGEILSISESPLLVSATLIALMAQVSQTAGQP
jgi:hypothetical protein